MHIESVPNRKSHPTILLRESYRADGKVKKRTLANLTDWPEQLVEGLRTLLRGGVALARADEALTISRSLPHGHVAAVLGTAEQLGLSKLLSERRGGPASRRYRDLVMALIVNRIIAPASKLATVRALNPETAAPSLGQRLGRGEVAEREIYESLDWLLEQQERVENALAKRHLAGGTLALFDVSSSYFEGRCCELASPAGSSIRTPAAPRRPPRRGQSSSPTGASPPMCCSALRNIGASRAGIEKSPRRWLCPVPPTSSSIRPAPPSAPGRPNSPDVRPRHQRRFGAARDRFGEGRPSRRAMGRQRGCGRSVHLGDHHPGAGARDFADGAP
jgi:hypothetical protein